MNQTFLSAGWTGRPDPCMGRIMSIPRALASLTLGGREIPLSPGDGESYLAGHLGYGYGNVVLSPFS